MSPVRKLSIWAAPALSVGGGIALLAAGRAAGAAWAFIIWGLALAARSRPPSENDQQQARP